MPTRLLALALLAPALSLAQETPAQPAPPGAVPVYPAQPVPPPPSAPSPEPYRAHTRSSWYIGFGLGTGNGNLKTQGGNSFSFTDVAQGGSTTNVALNFKVGGTLSQTLLLGFDLSAVSSRGTDDFGSSTTVTVTNYDAMLTWFPWETGFFLRGGAGLSAMTLSASAFGTTGSSTYTGGNVALGTGYAFWLGQNFNLTLNLDVSAQGYGNGNSGPKSSSAWALGVGFDWY
jgi:hypothetical protein